MFKIGLIILALIGLALATITTTTTKAFANGYMGGPAMGAANSGGGGGGSSSQGPSDTTTSPGGGGGAGPDTTQSNSAAAPAAGTEHGSEWWNNGWQQDHPNWTVADWYHHHKIWVESHRPWHPKSSYYDDPHWKDENHMRGVFHVFGVEPPEPPAFEASDPRLR